MTSQRALTLAVGTAVFVFVTGCGRASQTLVSAGQVQRAFVSAGLTTRILIDCKRVRKLPGVAASCPLKALIGPHATAVIGDFRDEVKTPYGAPVEAYVFDSMRAADNFEVATTSFNPETGSTVTRLRRFQRRNVVLYVTRRGEYRRKAASALAALR
jgi:hypothetical protein